MSKRRVRTSTAGSPVEAWQLAGHTLARPKRPVRVGEAPVGAGGFHIIASPLFSGLCCRPADPAKAHCRTLVLAFCLPSCGLGTWYWVLPDRISERVQGPDVSGWRFCPSPTLPPQASWDHALWALDPMADRKLVVVFGATGERARPLDPCL